MKKLFALLLAALMLVLSFGCTAAPAPAAAETTAPEATQAPAPEPTEAPKTPVDLVVVTSYSEEDGNRPNYEAGIAAYEAASGNKVLDASATSNEAWRAKVMADFETGAEPDVLFYYSGMDANKIVEAGKVVTLDEIRAEYPEYAANMKESMLQASPVDGKKYTVPVNGYWEGLFVNKAVLADCGVAVPGADYTWEQFLKDCEAIKAKGYTPIAVSLQEVPHYWFEFSIFNHGNVSNHIAQPASATDEVGQKWVAGLEDIATLYKAGYLPKNTLTATDAETVQMMADNQAAFLIDGSWKIGWFQENAKVEDFTVTYVPGTGERKATDIVGGLSMGYYITRKAWEDPAKRQAAVDFVMTMTTDEVVSTFGATAITALKNGTVPPADADNLIKDALAMTKGATGITAATQDLMKAEGRADLFANIKNIVEGKITAADALTSALSK